MHPGEATSLLPALYSLNCVRCLLALTVSIVALGIAPAAQSDLDALMERVLARRDGNWKKLQQYVLNERETLRVTGPGDTPFYGFRREYLWYPRDGRFIKSPLTADGVPVPDAERDRFEQQWIERQQRREERSAPPVNSGGQGGIRVTPGSVSIELPRGDSLEPGFVSAAYFLNFKFDPGQYALAGRETFDGRDVLRIEYYPTKMFAEGRTRPNRELRERDEDVERKMNKVSLVTLWVLPEEHQIVRYEFDNIDMDFLPAQHVLRFDRASAAMEMGQPFPGVWLPRTLRIGFELLLAIGKVEGQYSSEFVEYRLASVNTRIR